MLNICEHSNERRAGATSLEEVLKTSKKRLWMSHSVPYVVCHRLVSCLLVVVGTSQPEKEHCGSSTCAATTSAFKVNMI